MYNHHFGFSFVYHLSSTQSKSCFPVQKTWGVSSELKVTGKVGFWGRKVTRLSLQHLKQIVSLNYLGFHLKSLKTISSAFSASKKKVDVPGLPNDLYTAFSGLIKNVSRCCQDPWLKCFENFPSLFPVCFLWLARRLFATHFLQHTIPPNNLVNRL